MEATSIKKPVEASWRYRPAFRTLPLPSPQHYGGPINWETCVGQLGPAGPVIHYGRMQLGEINSQQFIIERQYALPRAPEPSAAVISAGCNGNSDPMPTTDGKLN